MEKNKLLNRFTIAGLILVLLSIVVCAFCLLDIDYSPMRRWGDCGDEGFWVHNARMKILFDHYRVDEFNQAVYGAPLFNYCLWLSFKCFGVSLYSARLVSLLAFLLAMVVVFFILRKQFQVITLLFFCFFLLISHEIIMYYAWATPIFLETLFYLLILLAYGSERISEYSKGSLIALFFLGAVFSKLSSLYFTVPLVFFCGRELFFTKRISYRFVLSFASVCILIIGAYCFFYYREHGKDIQQFLSGVAYSNIKTIPGILQAILIVPFNLSIFKYPSVIVIFILSVFRIIDILRRNKYDFRKSILTANAIEFYCLCWIFGSLVSLSFTGEVGFDRRMIHMYFPFSILSLYFVNEVLQSPEDRISVRSTNGKRFLKWVLFVSLSLWFFFYFFAIPKNRLFFVVLGINRSMLYYVCYLIVSVVISYWFCFRQRRRLLVYGLLGYFIASSCVLNGIWLLNRSYSVKEMNEFVENLPADDTKYLYGVNAHLYTINNSKLIPMWYRNPPMGKTQINEWFNAYADSAAFFYVNVDSMAGNNNSFLRSKDIAYIKPVGANREQTDFTKMRIAPFPYGNVSRLSASLVLVHKE